MKFIDLVGLLVATALAAFVGYQYTKSETYHPNLADFTPTTTISGVFEFTDGGKLLQSSWIDGVRIYEGASYAGGHGGFGLSYHIPERSLVKAQLVRIRTRSSYIWVVARLQAQPNGQVYVSRSPAELLESWRENSNGDRFSTCLFICAGVFGPYLMLRGILKG